MKSKLGMVVGVVYVLMGVSVAVAPEWFLSVDWGSRQGLLTAAAMRVGVGVARDGHAPLGGLDSAEHFGTQAVHPASLRRPVAYQRSLLMRRSDGCPHPGPGAAAAEPRGDGRCQRKP